MGMQEETIILVQLRNDEGKEWPWEEMERKEFKRDLVMKTIILGTCRAKFVTKTTGMERKIYLNVKTTGCMVSHDRFN